MRKQIAFATLNESELNQVVEWLRTETYAVVLDRVRKPRADGGLGLNISRSPLERLRDKHERLKKVNARIASGESLSLAELDAIDAGESPASSEAHDAIMQATVDLAKSGDQSATQLLALQRFADFPERAEIRQQRLDLDFEKFTHKLDMDAHRQQIALARLELAHKSFALRERMHEDRLYLALQKAESKTPTPQKGDQFGPFAKTRGDVSERVRIGLGISKEEAERRAALRKAYREAQSKSAAQQAQPDSNLTEAPNAQLTPQPLVEATPSCSLGVPPLGGLLPGPVNPAQTNHHPNLIDLLTNLAAEIDTSGTKTLTNENM
jgi:hypothetical protein